MIECSVFYFHTLSALHTKEFHLSHMLNRLDTNKLKAARMFDLMCASVVRSLAQYNIQLCAHDPPGQSNTVCASTLKVFASY